MARIALFLGVGALAIATTLGLRAGHVLRSLELSSVDTRFSIRGSTGRPKDVVVVAIDDKTFAGFQNRLQWPFPRRYHARVIDRIAAGRPRAVAVDIQFTERTDRADDRALLASVRAARHVVLATTEVDPRGRTNVLGGDRVLRLLGAEAGNASVPLDGDGVLRRISSSVDGLTTFGVLAASVAAGERAPAWKGSRWIDFAGPPGTVRSYSYSDVYFGRVQPDAFRDKVVVLGPVAPSLQDVHVTSASAGEPMPGAEVQANIVETALRGFPLRSVPGWVEIALITVLSWLPAVAALRLRALFTAAVAIGAGAAFAVAAQVAFDHGRVVSVVYPLLALVLSAFASLVVTAETERVRAGG
jgi:adenylate cyclase